MHSVSLSLSLSLCSFCLLFLLSRACYLATSLSLPHTFSLIWQQSEPCRWKSFQHISRKLIYFHNKWDPLSWIHLYTSSCTKQEVVSGPRLPLLHSPRLSLPVYPMVWSHTHAHALLIQTLSLLFLLCEKMYHLWFATETDGCAHVCVGLCVRGGALSDHFIVSPHFNNCLWKTIWAAEEVCSAIIHSLAWLPSIAD